MSQIMCNKIENEILSIGIKDGKYITCQMTKAFNFDEVIVVSICNVIMHRLIDNVPENQQIEFNDRCYQIFCQSFNERYKYIDRINSLDNN